MVFVTKQKIIRIPIRFNKEKVIADPREVMIRAGTKTLFVSLLKYLIIIGGRIGSPLGNFARNIPTAETRKIFTIAAKALNMIDNVALTCPVMINSLM